MRRRIDIEIKAGIFLAIGLCVFVATVIFMSGNGSLFQKELKVTVVFPDAGGLTKGAYVRSGGIKVGWVERIDFTETYDAVRITMAIDEKFQKRIHDNSYVKMQTQGVLGDKFLEISGGSDDHPFILEGQSLTAEQGKDLGAVLAEGTNAVQLLRENLANIKIITSAISKNNNLEHSIHDMAEITANLKDITHQLKAGSAITDLNATMKNLKSVSEKMKNGEGTIGALFNDASLFEDLKHLIGGANRNNVLKFFVRQAVKSDDEAAKKAAANAEEKDVKKKK